MGIAWGKRYTAVTGERFDNGKSLNQRHHTLPARNWFSLETAFLDSFYEKIPFKTEG
ncbi:MAG: hypothetical protein [Olavius algarvensis Gamma 1 endosymbiont]|nr:MAG: hypothetical protein [Olavius algarvensis Gamma 1 endosymbiont]